MRHKKYLNVLLIIIIFIIGSYSYCYAGTLKASVVKINITPDSTERLWLGGFSARTEPGDSVNDDIFMKILALNDGNNSVYIVATDLINIDDDYYESFIERMEIETDIKQNQLLWTFTHTHSAPVVTEDGSKNPQYSKMLKDKLIEGLKKAQQTLQPAKIGAGFGRSFMNINRRCTYSDGKVHLARNPYGICDKEFGCIKVEKTDGSPLAILVNYPCHGVALYYTNMKISGDAPGSVARYIEQELDSEAVVMYLNGAAGDVEPIYTCMRGVEDTNFELDMLGIMLGDDVLYMYKDIRVTENVELETIQKVINLPRKESEIKEHGPIAPFRVSVLRINDIILAGASGEIFNQIGINIKQMSPYPEILFVGYCNGSSGYLPTKHAFPEGGYEVDVTHTTPDGEWIFTHSVVELLRKIKSMDELNE